MADTNGGPNTPSFDLSSAAATQVRPGGAPARVFLNEKIVPYLLEGMKTITRDQPANPLQVLGEFLIQKSKEVEGDAKKESE
ncbi:Set1 complex component sdc1 [Penicillium subrubescens]|uniref:Set1 complex component sdc1 n=2 Tax=Penicillium subrubescens TaxID=1316194 RepID=A0A1Q5UHG1_9EURO|nr:Set1 complex component sdc1 [Penicillium subrubescens]